jgi:hypothetical protein
MDLNAEGPQTIPVKALDLYLDDLNPRHDPIADQPEIISHLLSKEKVLEIARDIAAVGLNPLEKFGVIQTESGHYVVVEGNRRLCALLLLNDPSRAPEGFKQTFIDLAAAKNHPSVVDCVLFSNRQNSRPWIDRRHLGEQDGIGIRAWNARQISRAKAQNDQVDANAMSLALIDFADSRGYIPTDKKDKILTTVTRYLGNPYFRQVLGIVSGRSEKEIDITVPYIEFDRVTEKFFYDLTKENPSVSSRSNKDDWVAYADQLKAEGFAPTTLVAKRLLRDFHIPPSNDSRHIDAGRRDDGFRRATNDIPGANDESPNDTENQPARQSPNKNPAGYNRNPDDRMYIVGTGFNINISNKMLKRTFIEMKSISVDDYPLAVALLTRAFLENVYWLYYEKMVSQPNNIKTDALLNLVIKHIDNDQQLTKDEKNSLGALKRVQQVTTKCLNPKTMGAYAHAGHYPSAVELKREWDNISAIVLYMIRKMQ